MLIGLFQLGLLGLQMGLGLLEHPRLFFEFLVGGFQLFLLHLQLFVELLGFGQHILQALTIAGTFNRSAEVVSDQLEQLDIAISQRPQETQLDHPVDLPVVAGRHHQHTARQAFTQAGVDLEVVLRHIIKAQQAPLAHRLGEQALLMADQLFTGFLLGRKAVACHPPQTTLVITHVKRRHHTAQVGGEKAQDIGAQHRQRQLPEHLPGQLRLPAA
ncbi:hypothetical protein D3C78_524160 [compost metagenome]